MPAKEIKELRQEGKLEEALVLAKSELQADPDNIWPKRNISWVYYDYLKQNSSPEHFDSFISYLKEIENLHLSADEHILNENLCWQIGKMAFGISKGNPHEQNRSIRLFEASQTVHLPAPSEARSFLFKGLHKCLKETHHYIHFADWWGFTNFLPADYEKEKLPNGKDIMSIVEQAYIAYAKHLLPQQSPYGEKTFDNEKAEAFLPLLAKIVDDFPQYQYPPYFQAKLLLALGDKEHILGSLLPFAKKKRNDFWVWEVMAEAFADDPEKIFACYCKALTCKSPEEMLVNLRQKMARILIAKQHFDEARTEIDELVRVRTEHDFKIPAEVVNWQNTEWYKNARPLKSNIEFFKTYVSTAEALLFSDVPELTVIVEFVNKDKSIVNFIASEDQYGFFKYDRFLSDVHVGDILKVRFQSGSNDGIHLVYTAAKASDEEFRKKFLKDISGTVKIPLGKPFGFIEDAFVHPSLVTKYKLTDGLPFNGRAIKSYNREKKQWGWKLL